VNGNLRRPHLDFERHGSPRPFPRIARSHAVTKGLESC
jgi:hypothetical protein